MTKRNAISAQSGGVTAVINASACGVIETARQHKDKIGKVFAGRNGIIGALTEELIDTSKESVKTITALKHTPGGAFGSCRYKLKSLEQNRKEYERLIDVFKAHNIGYFFYNGGGDSGYIESSFDENGDAVPAGIEDWCYQQLESHFGGWEINEGSDGAFIFDFNTSTVTLDHTYNTEEQQIDTLYEESFNPNIRTVN